MSVKKVSGSPNQELALTNCLFLRTNEHALLSSDGDIYVEVLGRVFTARADDRVESGCIGLNSLQRRWLGVQNGAEVHVDVFAPAGRDAAGLSAATFEVDLIVRGKARGTEEIDVVALSESMRTFTLQFIAIGQEVAVPWRDFTLRITTKGAEAVNIDAAESKAGGEDASVERGMLTAQTQLIFEKAANSPIKLEGQPEGQASRTNIFRSDWSFEKMGVGGLDQEFSDIFRRAFASRIFPVSTMRKLGIAHVKGMLLYGPPGTGKTLIARQIGKMLNGKEPKVVNGPEVLSKYVGQSEENIRALFADAEREMADRGDESDLHIIIFDEIDSVCKQRGSNKDGTGVHDTVVNQLLSKIDGVHALNNILVIGMTNRRDMIDEALLRPGRLEVQVEISLPDETGRYQILSIHTASMRQAKYLSADVSLHTLAAETKNFSGSEIEGLVKSASSFALGRQVSAENIKEVSSDTIQVTRADFEQALQEVKPAFGVSTDDLSACVGGELIPYGGALPQLQETASTLIAQLRSSTRTSLLSILLNGPPGSGKTALAASFALQSQFPFVRLVSPNAMVGMGEAQKSAVIAKIFDDAHRSPFSIILLDDLERLLDYVRIGPRFSNIVLQTLLTCIKKVPQKKCKLVILATTASSEVLESLEMLDAFNVKLQVPAMAASSAMKVLEHLRVANAAELSPLLATVPSGLPIKKLLLVSELCLGDGQRIDPAKFEATLRDAGLLGW